MKKGWGRTLLVLGAAALLLGNSGARRLARNFLALRRASRRLEQLQQEQSRLSRSLKALRSDDAALEAAARGAGLIKPGEVEYRFSQP